MQLETLLKELNLTAHTARLSEWRNDLLRDHAAELQTANFATQAATTKWNAVKATLAEHQTLTDEGMAAAAPLVNALAGMEIHEAVELAAIFAQFAQFGSHRAAAKAANVVREARAALEAAEAEAAAIAK